MDSRYRKIRRPEPDLVLISYASNVGAVAGEKSTGGRWMSFEKELHLNILELLSCDFNLKSLCAKFQEGHIRGRIDIPLLWVM